MNHNTNESKTKQIKKEITEEQAAVRGGRRMRAKMGTYTVVVSLIVLAALIVVNLMVSLLPSRYTALDLSANQMYSVSDSAQRAAHKLKEDVTIYYLKDSSQSEDIQMETFLERFASHSSHIKLRAIDPVVSPNFTAKYTTETLDSYSLIIESAKRYRVISYFDMYYYEGGIPADDTETLNYYYTYYGTLPPIYFNGENVIISALDYVTTDNIPTAYMLTGHGETAFSSALQTTIASANIELVDSLNLMTAGSIPEDCDLLIINANMQSVSVDLTEAEAQTIISYIQNGGSVLMTTMPGVSAQPNLLSVAQACGLDAQDGFVVESDADHYLTGYPHYLLPQVTEHPITASLMSTYYAVVPLAHGITRTETLPDGITITPLFSTTSSAYLVDVNAQTIEKTADSKTGTFWVGVAVEHAGGGKLIWLPSPAMLTDAANQLTGANYGYLTGMLNWTCPRDTIQTTADAVSMDSATLVLTAGTALLWSAIFVLLIPIVLLVTGLVIWIRRRRK